MTGYALHYNQFLKAVGSQGNVNIYVCPNQLVSSEVIGSSSIRFSKRTFQSSAEQKLLYEFELKDNCRSDQPVWIFVQWLQKNIYYVSKESKKEGKDQESIQSTTTPDPGYHWESDNFTM